ncbi:alanine racemase [Oribacterium sp. WCC10]|uniref:alanine racemase n=1 Tax=Oribacterium sp. WCC10 TaxID=1855343 RepID=UPI0008E2166F|nr:alanine racemase [Oribacterium sp. WCC10]SFG66845.1 alanine racemase [Oribacterium sp. WCC10]
MISTLRRAWAEINLDNLAFNYNKIREYIGKDVKFLGVVKADAYGHGSVQVGQKLQELGADYLAVSSIDEAMELRFNGITMPILILGHTPREQVDRLICFNITQAVTCEAKAIEYSEEAVKYGGTLKIHIKVDSGMSRLGYICENDYFQHGVDGIAYACTLPGLEPEGIFTHFAVSDEPGEECVDYTKHQFKLFTDVVDAVEKKLDMKFKLRHCANTGATVDYPETYLDMVRPGLLLYGYGEFAKRLGLKPMMSMKTTVSTIKIYPEGTKISYGGLYTTERDTRIGVIPYGYADGFWRSLSNRYSVWTDAGLAPVRGRICMDMCMIDLTDKKDVVVGSEIEIFGDHNPIEKMAEMADTIPYELVCAVSKRVHRVYISDGEIVYREVMLRM